VNGPGGSLGNAKADHVDIREKTSIDGKLVVRLGGLGCDVHGKRRLAVGENGFISRNPLRSCRGLKCGTRERDATTPSSHKLFAPPRNLLRPCMVDSACLLDSHAPRDQASPQFPTPGLSPPFTISLLLGRVYILGTRTDNIAPVLTVRDLDSVESVPTRPVSSGMSLSPVQT
jgi:hypothetical protein